MAGLFVIFCSKEHSAYGKNYFNSIYCSFGRSHLPTISLSFPRPFHHSCGISPDLRFLLSGRNDGGVNAEITGRHRNDDYNRFLGVGFKIILIDFAEIKSKQFPDSLSSQ